MQDGNKVLVAKYQRFMQRATHIVFISPVWWARCTSMLEGFFDQVLTPSFAYNFKQLTKLYGLPIPRLKIEESVLLSHTWSTCITRCHGVSERS